ncbi:MAG TPA: hypothetical protein VIS96_13770 [Terrimicrobiaceae bacterium]
MSEIPRMNEQAAETSQASLTLDVVERAGASDPTANPFKLVVDPIMRARLRRGLFTLIENHDEELAKHVSEGRLALDSYKEYVELFARSLKETMESAEGVAYLLESCGFDVKLGEINLRPETRWKA